LQAKSFFCAKKQSVMVWQFAEYSMAKSLAFRRHDDIAYWICFALNACNVAGWQSRSNRSSVQRTSGDRRCRAKSMPKFSDGRSALDQVLAIGL
jgi:hypothetical protein